MLKRTAITLLASLCTTTVVPSQAGTLSSPTSPAPSTPSAPSTPTPPTPAGAPATPTPVQVVEYYHAGFDHYFVTGNASEMQALDNGQLTGWTRTGFTFTAFAPGAEGAGQSPVCRF